MLVDGQTSRSQDVCTVLHFLVPKFVAKPRAMSSSRLKTRTSSRVCVCALQGDKGITNAAVVHLAEGMSVPMTKLSMLWAFMPSAGSPFLFAPQRSKHDHTDFPPDCPTFLYNHGTGRGRTSSI